MIIKFKCTYLRQIMQYLNKFTLSKNLNKFIKNVNKNKFDYTFSFSISLVAMKILKKMTSMVRQISHFSLFLQSIFRNGVLFKHFPRGCCFCTYPTCKSQVGMTIQGRSGHVACNTPVGVATSCMIDTWQGLGDAPGSLAISAYHTGSSRLIGGLSLLWSHLVGAVQQRSHAVCRFAARNRKCHWQFALI